MIVQQLVVIPVLSALARESESTSFYSAILVNALFVDILLMVILTAVR